MQAIIDHCSHSALVDLRACYPSTENPNFFSTLPVALSKHESTAIMASEDFRSSWDRAAYADGFQSPDPPLYGCEIPLGNFVAWAYPECVPERVEILAKLCDLTYLWDGIFLRVIAIATGRIK
ncbi:hypothetical protein BDV12DRAFT_205075 [Aspergillus spectabilis]